MVVKSESTVFTDPHNPAATVTVKEIECDHSMTFDDALALAGDQVGASRPPCTSSPCRHAKSSARRRPRGVPTRPERAHGLSGVAGLALVQAGFRGFLVFKERPNDVFLSLPADAYKAKLSTPAKRFAGQTLLANLAKAALKVRMRHRLGRAWGARWPSRRGWVGSAS